VYADQSIMEDRLHDYKNGKREKFLDDILLEKEIPEAEFVGEEKHIPRID